MRPLGPQNMFGQWAVCSSPFLLIMTSWNPFLPHTFHSCRGTSSCEVELTHGAVRSHPVGVTAAQPSVWYEGPVAMALVWALGPGQLTVEPSPAWLTVALSIHADAIVGTCRIQAIHCIKADVHQRAKKTPERKTKWAKSSTTTVRNKFNIINCFYKERDATQDIFFHSLYTRW